MILMCDVQTREWLGRANAVQVKPMAQYSDAQ